MTLVSAIVPCFQRAAPAERAVRSALEQRLPPDTEIEVLACIDGPQPGVRARLEAIGDARLRIVQLERRRGHAAARHRGVTESRGDWIGFLDDDDLWMPEKIGRQLEAAELARERGIALPIVGCRVEARLERGSLVWPSRVPEPGEPIDDYLYSRTGLSSIRTGHTLVQTSMILAPRRLFDASSFRPGLRRHADPDFLLRACRQPGAGVVFPADDRPLAVWSLHGGSRVSGDGDWRYSIAWARRRRDLLSPRAISGFLTGPAAHRAGRLTHGLERLRAFASLARHASRLGRPSLWDFVALGLFWADAGRFRPTRPASHARGAPE